MLETKIPKGRIDRNRIFDLTVYFSPDGRQTFYYTDSKNKSEYCVREYNYSADAGWAFGSDIHYRVAEEHVTYLREIGYRRKYVEAVWNPVAERWVMAWEWIPDSELVEYANDRNLHA